MAIIAAIIQSIIGAIIVSLAMYDLFTNKHDETITCRIVWNAYDIIIMAFGVFLMAW